jgi:hypothetical protein
LAGVSAIVAGCGEQFAPFWWHMIKAKDDLSDGAARIFPGLLQIIDPTYSDKQCNLGGNWTGWVAQVYR